MLRRWLYFYGTNLIYCHRHSALNELFLRKDRQKRKHSREQKEQNPQLRCFYQHKLSEFNSCHLVFVDESGCDKRIGCRQTGWSPLGVTPVQVSKFHRGQRYQILPAYAQDCIMLARILLKVQQMPHSSNPSLNSSYSTVGGGRNRNLC